MLLWFTVAGQPAHADVLGSQQAISPTIISTTDFPLGDPAAAYDSKLDRYLVVWSSEHDSPGTGAIWGRFVDASGSPAAAPFKIANVGGAAGGLKTLDPRIAYSKPLGRYAVAFAATQGGSRAASDEEIYVQWIGANGDQLGGPQPISQGTTGTADKPQIVPNDIRGGVSIVYHAARPGSVPTFQSYGQVVTPTAVGAVRRITSPDDWTFSYPSLAVNGADGNVAVASISSMPGKGQEIVTYLLTPDLLPITGMKRPVPVGTQSTHKPAIVWNGARNEYLIAWPSITTDIEINGIRLSANLDPIGPLTALSAMGPAGAPDYGAGVDVGLAVSPISDQYAAFWMGDTVDATHTDNQFEVWTHAYNGLLAPAAAQTQVSDLGPLPGSSTTRELLTGAIAYDSARDRWLVVFPGRTGNDGNNVNDFKVFTRIVSPVPAPVVPAAPVAAAPADTGGGGQSQPAPPCPGTSTYATRKGTRCAPGPGPTFSVAPFVRKHHLLRMLVTPTLKGETVSVGCTDKCTKHAKTKRSKAGKRNTTFNFGGLGAKVGSTLEFRVLRPGFTARYVQYKVSTKYPYLVRTEAGCRMTDDLKAAC